MSSSEARAVQDSYMQARDSDGESQPELTANHDVEEDYYHPDARALFRACPWIQFVPIYGKAAQAYGPRCVLALGLCYFLNKGLGYYLIVYSRYPMFRNRFGIDGTRYQRLSSIAGMGFSIKAFSAMFSDTFAIAGYTKRWYCAGACVVGAAFALAYGLMPAKPESSDVAAAFVFLTCFCMAIVDILSEGHYSRLMRGRPSAGPAMVSWIWWFIMAAALIAAAVQGPISDIDMPQVGCYVGAATQFLSVIFFIFNWYGERYNTIERVEDARRLEEDLLKLRAEAAKAAKDAGNEKYADDYPVEKDLHPELGDEEAQRAEALDDAVVADSDPAADDGDAMYLADVHPCCCGFIQFNKGVMLRNWRFLVYSVVMVLSVIVMTVVTILGDSWDLLYAAIATAVVCLAMAFWAAPLVIAKANVFIYMVMTLYLQVPGPVDSFFMAEPDCVADGPHFTYTFYSTVGAVIGNIGGIAGVTCFNYIFSRRGYQFTYIVTTVVQILASLFDIIIIKRWNMHIGIPDHAMYILGDAVVYQVCYMMSFMPTVILLSRICPRGSESMVYAICAGFANMGQTMAATIGSLLIEFVWPFNTDAGSCDFSNVPMLLVIGHIVFPLGIVPLAYILLPRTRICDDLDVDGKAVRKEHKRLTEENEDQGTNPEEPLYDDERASK